ncbi:MAG: glycosyltransferase [Eubacteriales bacterium]|nr:glycosyltransferase [Eubacteriales bacterium]
MNNTIAIIVTYNRIELLKECLIALNESDYFCDILIVDNASSDGTKEYLNDLLNKKNNNYIIYYYNTNENIGGAGGYNFGLKKAIELDNKYKYFWLMDDDCIVSKNSLSKLINVAKEKNDDFGFLSSKVLWSDGSICKTNIQRKKVARKIRDFKNRIVRVDYASFVSVLFKREDVIKLGFPIKDFFIWTDDLEYTRRFSKISNSYLINDSIVIHKCKQNIGVDITKESEDRIFRYKYIYRNDFYTFKKEGLLGIIFLFTRLIYHILKVLFLSNSKINKIKTILNGYIEGISFSPKVEYANTK